jgi:hypothetical protein
MAIAIFTSVTVSMAADIKGIQWNILLNLEDISIRAA